MSALEKPLKDSALTCETNPAMLILAEALAQKIRKNVEDRAYLREKVNTGAIQLVSTRPAPGELGLRGQERPSGNR